MYHNENATCAIMSNLYHNENARTSRERHEPLDFITASSFFGCAVIFTEFPVGFVIDIIDEALLKST